jgi:pSer/pThr/pTyr-binding forkhead associated (FHA) protein
MIELRILSGARAGHVERFTKSVVSVGRHALNDLRLDQERDIEASRRHAEIRTVDGRMSVHDLSSTNGTWVNGERVNDESQLRSGDVIAFGREGPKVEVHVLSGGDALPAPSQSAQPQDGSASRPTPISAPAAQVSSGSPTPKIIAGLALVAVAAGAAYWAGGRSTDSPGTVERYASATQQAAGTLDLAQINSRNANAVAFVAFEIAGRAYAGTAFCVEESGLLITNRHNVQDANGVRASRVAAKFRDTRDWVPLRIVAVAGAEDDDLALLRIDQPGVTCPTTVELAQDAATIPEGSPVVTIGYPLALDARMEGTGEDFVAKTTLYPGAISKQVTGVMQIASYAGHGSSGSPVFDARGLVIAVIWGGPRDSGGQIIYAVPADRARALIATQ